MHFQFAFQYYSRAGVIDGSKRLLFRSDRRRRKSEPCVSDEQLGWSFAARDAKFLLNCKSARHSSVLSRVLTLLPMRSRMARNSSGGNAFGSGMSQSSRRFARTNGQASPQPIVATKSNSMSERSTID